MHDTGQSTSIRGAHTAPRSTRDNTTVLYTIKLPTGLRIGVCLHEVTAVEEVVSEVEPLPGGVPPVKKRYIRLFLRNGSSFTVADDDRELYDHIHQFFKLGELNEPEDYTDAAS